MKALLTPAAERRITDDWARLFPSLGIYEPLQLLRRVGPILEGIVLGGESTSGYCPTFHVHSLLRKFPSINTMTLAHPLLDERSRTPEDIEVALHEAHHRDAAARLAKQAPLPLSGNLRFDDVIAAYRAFLESPDTYYDTSLYEDMAAIYSWMGRSRDAERVLDEAATVFGKWPPNVLREGAAVWRARTANHVRDAAALRRLADEQARALDVTHLPVAELVE